ncbi:L-threonylcarbamoyladenylate synthase [Acidobacteria bacterium AH-259-G07]|nr:L-threonylcarbamoyladenylate synthase [Acidobacteria bacterium AH-259-G07]
MLFYHLKGFRFQVSSFRFQAVYFDPASPTREVIEKAAQVIRQGGIVLHPSDTIYGLGCDPFNERALQRLFAMKGRSEHKGVLLLLADLSWIKSISANIPEVFYELAEAFWPGPVTFLLEGGSELSPLIRGEDDKVGLRWPDRPFLQLWMKAIPGPVISTSANRSGQPPPEMVQDLKRLFYHQVDLFLESGEINQDVQPSTVVDLTTNPPRIVREGQAAEQVRRFLNQAGRS